MFREMVGKSSGSGAHILEEALRLLTGISRTLIREFYLIEAPFTLEYVIELLVTNRQWRMKCAELEGRLNIPWPCFLKITF